jgi:integrase
VASIQKHRNRWRVKWHDENGRALYESFATKAEAITQARRIEARTVLDGAPPVAVDPDALTLEHWWARWEPGRQWADSTRMTHTGHWRRYIKPVFGRVPLVAITTADIRRWHRKLEQKGLRPRTIAAVHRTFSMILGGAVEDELIRRNPATAAKLRTTRPDRPVALDAATVTAFIAAVDETSPKLATFARTVAATGLRRSEAAGLTWDRVDLDGGVLTIDRQLDYLGPVPKLTPTKTRTSRRVLLTPGIVAMLREHRVTQPVAVLDGSGFVFARPDGRPWPRETLRNAWQRAATKLAKDGTPLPAEARGWHTLRHTVASRLLEAGVPPAEAAELLGHSADMLLGTYTHVTDRAAADDRLRAALTQ